jgi:hypothetical protein
MVGSEGVAGLGHAGSGQAKSLAAAAGVPVMVVHNPSAIVGALIDAFGQA